MRLSRSTVADEDGVFVPVDPLAVSEGHDLGLVQAGNGREVECIKCLREREMRLLDAELNATLLSLQDLLLEQSCQHRQREMESVLAIEYEDRVPVTRLPGA